MQSLNKSGFREIEHTADVELQVWAPDFNGLLEQAALGLYELCGVKYNPLDVVAHNLRFEFLDFESMLVEFLNELLYLMEEKGLVFDQFSIELNENGVEAKLMGGKLILIEKEIKAVTYHKLSIKQTDQGLQTRLVFDI